MTFLRPRQRQQAGWDSSKRIRSLLGVRGVLKDAEMVAWDSPAIPGWRWWLIDTGKDGFELPVQGETALQVLFAEDDDHATISMDGDTLPFLPGDNVLVNQGTMVSLGPQLIVLAFMTGEDSDRVGGPTHGLDEFDGFNRRTRCIGSEPIRLDRWKLTGPQEFVIGDRPIVVAGLFGSMSLIGENEIFNLKSFETIVATSDFTVVPDGLGYLAIAYPVL
jgi:hypothetical protein